MRKFLIAAIILLFMSCPAGVLAENLFSAVSLPQQMGILAREISVLKALISNSKAEGAVDAPSYMATDLSNGSVALEKNSSKSYPIASVTKLMNAVVALENINMDRKIILTNEMLKPYGGSPALFRGLNISARSLLIAELTQSSNDAACALSHFAGTEKFLTLMNQKAKELGMENTAYYDANGIMPENRSTASDLAKLMAYIYKKHPVILTITKLNDFWLPDAKGKMNKFQNENNFYYLNDFMGGKAGYIPESKQAFASIFSINGRPYAITVLYSQNRQADIFRILNMLKAQK